MKKIFLLFLFPLLGFPLKGTSSRTTKSELNIKSPDYIVTITNFFYIKDKSIIGDFSYKQDVCNPLSVQFFNLDNTSNTHYWSLGDGTIILNTENPVHVYTSPGNYTVKHCSGNCIDTTTKIVSVGILPEDILLTPDATICINTTKQLLTQPALSFCWSPTTYLNNPSSPNPVTSATEPITYYFTAEMIGINAITNGDFNQGDNGFISDYNFASNNTTEGQYFVGTAPQIWNRAFSNCTDHTSSGGNMLLVNGSPIPNVKVWTQTVNVTPNTNYAFSAWIQALYPENPAQLSFSINNADVGALITATLPTCIWSQFYTTWNSGNNTNAIISIVNKNTIVTGNDFALDDISFAPVMIKKDSVKISIAPAPNVTTIADVTVCKNIPTELTSTGAIQYSWMPTTGLSSPSVPNPVATPAETTEYIVTGTNAEGCTAQDAVTVFIKQLPEITVSKSNDIGCGVSNAQLLASGADIYAWSPAAGLNDSHVANPVANPASTTIYSVTGSSATTQCTSTESITVLVKDSSKPIPFIANTFTPNDDGLNDCFKVNHFKTIKVVDITIYNRYGNLVFHTKDPAQCWDGTYKGQPADQGLYVYYIKVFNDCGEEIRKGNVLLLK